MGFLDKLVRSVTDVVRQQGRPAAASRGSAPSPKEVPEALRGPEPGALLTADEIEAATGSRPVGEGDRRSGGSETDVGWFRVCIWQLADGGELIVNSTRIRDDAGLELWRSRWNDPGWQNAPNTKPLAGVGDDAKWCVKKASKKKSPGGGTELHVDAKQSWYTTSFVHTSPAGSKDPAPLAALTAELLARLTAAG